MDTFLVTAGLGIPLVLALGWAIWFLVAQCRKERRRRAPTSHVFRGHGEAVTVAELLEEALEHGESVRLNWSEEDEAQAKVGSWSGIRPYAQDQLGTGVMGSVGEAEEWPTAILPRVEDLIEEE